MASTPSFLSIKSVCAAAGTTKRAVCRSLQLMDESCQTDSGSPSTSEIAATQHFVGRTHLRTRPQEDIFNAADEKIKGDIILMIAQYLNEEGYNVSKSTVLDEANMKWHEREESLADIKRMKKAIMEGDWAEVDKLCAKPIVKHHKSFLYSVYKQQFLEYIEHHETQKAFAHLNKRLKPLEHLQSTPNEFKDLCYVLTAKSIHDAPSLRNWEGIGPSREKLVQQFQTMVNLDDVDRDGVGSIPPNRLLNLLRQAVAYQIEGSLYHPLISPKITTLLQDYTALVIPNLVKHSLHGHLDNVKCVAFGGEEGKYIVSGSSDNTCRLWDVESGECRSTLHGHTSRIWDVSTDKSGRSIASASGDTTVKIWDYSQETPTCVSTLEDSSGDVYSVRYHPSGSHVVTGGYDKVVRLYDLSRQTVIKSFSGHQLSVSKAVFSPLGNLIISGSKDSTIKFWDVVSGLCIKTISSHLGEVTSVECNTDGTLMLSSSKDNSNRLWDIRMLRPIRRFKGHQNTSKNFIRAGFAGTALVVGGSEDGVVYMWDIENANVLQTLKGHDGVVYSAVWNAQQSLLCSCSDDGLVKSWWYDESKPLFPN
ncbi:WD40-repeat-containing domain protein [Cladochytrium replicatum]|nr:WD40-repeat-containing domain protein [Cladochytrium replicatum]